MKIAAACYPPDWHVTHEDRDAKLSHWVREAAEAGAELLVFPEYAGIEAALIGAPDGNGDPLRFRDRMAEGAENWCSLHADLAKRFGVTILAGSLAVREGTGFVNRAYLCTPEGGVGHQDKLILTPYERREMHMTPGSELKVFDTGLGRLAILICYDSEFPLLARAALEAGADMLLVPSCTEAPAGQTRVRQSARARAIEGQCLVVQAPLTGEVEGCDLVEVDTGRAGIFAPPDLDLPPDGILAQGETDVPGWTYAEVDLAAIAEPRRSGQVGNFGHWPEQDHRLANVTAEDLRRDCP